MKLTAAVLSTALLAGTVAGCSSADQGAKTATVGHHHAATVNNNAAEYTIAPVAPTAAPDTETMICGRFTRLMPRIIRDIVTADQAPEGISPARSRLSRDDLRLSRWSGLVYDNVGDATFSNLLGDLADALGAEAGYSTVAWGDEAAVRLGHVNGYCKFDVN